MPKNDMIAGVAERIDLRQGAEAAHLTHVLRYAEPCGGMFSKAVLSRAPFSASNASS